MTPHTAGVLLIALVLGLFAGVALQELRQPDIAADTIPKTQGALLFDSVCANCHGATGEGTFELKSPSIASLPDWYVVSQVKKFRTDMRGAAPEDIAGAQMRAIAHTLTDEAIEQVASHVASLPRHPTRNTLGGNADDGRESYQLHCEECHFSDGVGDFSFRSAPLIGLQDWHLAAQLEKFRSLERGTHPHDLEGAKMTTPSGRFHSPEDEKNVLAYIAHLARTH